MMWLTIARSELHHTFRRPATYVFIGLLALLSLGMASGKMTISSGDTSVGGKAVWVNAQIGVSYLVATCLLLGHGRRRPARLPASRDRVGRPGRHWLPVLAARALEALTVSIVPPPLRHVRA